MIASGYTEHLWVIYLTESTLLGFLLALCALWFNHLSRGKKK